MCPVVGENPDSPNLRPSVSPPLQRNREFGHESQNGNHREQVSNGTFFRFSLPGLAEGDVRVLKKNRGVGGVAVKTRLFNMQGLSEIYDESDAFGDAFSVYAGSDAQARAILTPEMKDNLLALKKIQALLLLM